MDALIGVAGLVLVAAITPGPNNLVVMRLAARSGFVRTLPAIAGIVLGGLAMLVLVSLGAGTVFAAEPVLRTLIAVGGGAYLCWLGCDLVARSFAGGATGDTPAGTKLPAGLAGLFGFQFLNPKSWVMVLTAISAMPAAHGATAFLSLAALFTFIPVVCLGVWSSFGAALAKCLARPRVRAWSDRVMGVLLVASALALVWPDSDIAYS
jgi:homoserine/homoserine lactone efflux protein